MAVRPEEQHACGGRGLADSRPLFPPGALAGAFEQLQRGSTLLKWSKRSGASPRRFFIRFPTLPLAEEDDEADDGPRRRAPEPFQESAAARRRLCTNVDAFLSWAKADRSLLGSALQRLARSERALHVLPLRHTSAVQILDTPQPNLLPGAPGRRPALPQVSN